MPAFRSGRVLVGLAGTVSALARYDQGLESYDRDAVHHYRLSRDAVERALVDLASRRLQGELACRGSSRPEHR